MNYKILIKFLFAVLFIISGNAVFAQDTTMAHEISGDVPELEEFHSVIYEIWHNAYPNKDYAALRKITGDVELKAGKIYEVKLQGILRDKEAKWNEGLAEFKKAVDEYKAAASGSNDEQLLNSAEVLHSKFEMMVRIIRPVLKEVDDFHKALYVVYHKYLAEKDYGKIKSSVDELKAKAEAIINAKPNKKVESKLEAFKSAAAELLTAVNELAEKCSGTDNSEIEKAAENMHTKYQKLEAVFE